MLINILCLIIGIAATLIWIKVVKAKTPINYQKFAKDKFWLIFTGVTIVAVAYLYFYLPQVFKWLAVDVWGIPTSSVGEDKENKVLQLTDLGPLGDIYGSLNTLFTSATLAFVVYATLLQREANKDAREAMADQLEHAKDSTAEQLKQARDATATQLKQARKAVDDQLAQAREATKQQLDHAKKLSDIQLKHAKESINRQLVLAQKTHEAQIQETKNSFFTSQFYNLLNYKNERFKDLSVCDKEKNEIKGHVLFRKLVKILHKKIIVDNKGDLEKLDKLIIKNAFEQACKELNNNETYYELFAYFENYISLINLINDAKLMDVDKKFFWSILRRSMISNEQKCMFLLAPMWGRIYGGIKDARLFNTFTVTESWGKFALNFYSKNSFSNPSWLNFFKEENKKTPA